MADTCSLRLELSRKAFLCCIAASGIVMSVGVSAQEQLKFGLTPVFLISDIELLERLKSYPGLFIRIAFISRLTTVLA